MMALINTTVAVPNCNATNDLRNNTFSPTELNLPFNESTDFNDDNTKAGYMPAIKPTPTVNSNGNKIKYGGKSVIAGISLPNTLLNIGLARIAINTASNVAKKTNITDSIRNCAMSCF